MWMLHLLIAVCGDGSGTEQGCEVMVNSVLKLVHYLSTSSLLRGSSLLHLSLSLSLTFSCPGLAGWGRGCGVQLAGQCFLCYTLLLADRGLL